MFLRKTLCFFRRHIVPLEDTLSLGKTHCLLRLNNDCRSSLACRSLARSLARSIDHSLARSLARSIARSLTDMCSLQSQYKGAAFGRHHKGGRAAFGRAAPFVVSFVLALKRAHVSERTSDRASERSSERVIDRASDRPSERATERATGERRTTIIVETQERPIIMWVQNRS